MLHTVATLVFLVFLILRLDGHTGWEWVWVLCPLWIYYGLCLVSAGSGAKWPWLGKPA